MRYLILSLCFFPYSIQNHAASPQPITEKMYIDNLIIQAADKYDLDHKLLHAIVRVESNYNPLAIGTKYGELGLFQLRPEYHKCASINIYRNIFCGAKYLYQLKQKYGIKYPKGWFVAFNRGHIKTDPKKTRYYRLVMKHYESGGINGYSIR